MGEDGSLVKADFVTVWQHFIICLSFIGFDVSCLFSWKLKISWKVKTSCNQSCRTALLWTAAHFKPFLLNEPFLEKNKPNKQTKTPKLWAFDLANSYGGGFEAVTALRRRLEKGTWRVKLNGKMNLKSFCLWDFAECLWNVNLWLLKEIVSHVLRKDVASLRSWAMKQAVPQSQWLAAEATASQLCRCKGFPYGFAYNPFPLTANEYWRKGCYLERLCISSRAREKWCVLVRVLQLEKRLRTDVKTPAVCWVMLIYIFFCTLVEGLCTYSPPRGLFPKSWREPRLNCTFRLLIGSVCGLAF